MVDGVHLIVTDEEDHGLSAESPQLPGFAMGRPTHTEFFRDYRQVLKNIGVTGQVKAHRQRHFTHENGREYLVRFAEDGDREERGEVVQRIHRVLGDPDIATELLDEQHANPMGEVVLVACTPHDKLGELAAELYAENDLIMICAAVSDIGLFTTLLASPDAAVKHPDWMSAANRGWSKETTVSEILQTLAKAPLAERRLLVDA